MAAADARHAGRRLVLVSGAPGAGKSTLAGPLAVELGFALLTKDRIKETLHDSLGPGPAGADLAGAGLGWSRKLGAAAMELLWTVAGQAAAVVLEANFRPRSEYERGRLAGLLTDGGRLVEVYCCCPPELAMARFAARATASHPVHVMSSVSAAFLAEFDQPIGMGDLVEVDTTTPVDIPALARQIQSHLAVAPTTSHSPPAP